MSDLTTLTSTSESLAQARVLIDQVHSNDPAGLELGYADSMESWVIKLDSQADQLVRLAARCQHLDRFSHPRSNHPEGKAGYLKWRRELYTIQSTHAESLLLTAGVTPSDASSVRRWVSKENLALAQSSDPTKRAKVEDGTQLLEDAAVLVFLEKEIQEFVGTKPEYSRGKWVEILKKTWKKLSPRGQSAALALAPSLAPSLQELVGEAIN